MLRYLIGIGLPYLGVIGMLPWVAMQDRNVLGMPFIYLCAGPATRAGSRT